MKRTIALVCAFVFAAILLPFGMNNGINKAALLPLEGEELVVITTSLPEAKVGNYYEARISTNYPEGSVAFEEWWNPGSGNVLPGIGLSLSRSGVVSGTPTRSGSFTFFVLATSPDAPNEAYGRIRLTVVDAPPDPTPAPTPEPTPTPTEEPQPTPVVTPPPETEAPGKPTPEPGVTPRPKPTPTPGKPTPVPKPTPYPTPRPTVRPSSAPVRPSAAPNRTAPPDGRPTPAPTEQPTERPQLPGADCEFVANSIIYYEPGAQFNVILVSGMGVNCIPGSVTDALPQGVDVVKNENNSVISIKGMIPQNFTDPNNALLSDSSFSFGLPLLINSRIYMFRYRVKPIPAGAQRGFPTGTPLTVNFGR